MPARVELSNDLALARDRIAELERDLSDYKNAWKSCFDEKYHGKELHCTCVPALKKRVRELDGEVATLRGVLEEWVDSAWFPPVMRDRVRAALARKEEGK